jgi:hypothetical protein
MLDATLSKLRNSSTRKGTILATVLEKHQDFLNTLSMQVVDGFADPTTVGTYSNGVITLSKEALAVALLHSKAILKKSISLFPTRL